MKKAKYTEPTAYFPKGVMDKYFGKQAAKKESTPKKTSTANKTSAAKKKAK